MNFQAAVKQSLLNTCFRAVHEHAYNFITDQFVGSLVRKVNRYDRAFEDLADQFVWGLGQTIIQSLGLAVGLYILNKTFFVLFLFWLLVYTIYIVRAVRWKRQQDLAKSEEDSKLTGQLADGITNFHTIKVFASLALELKSFYKRSQSLKEALLRSWRASWWLELGQSIWFSAFDMGALALSVYYWYRGVMTIGDVALVQMYSGQLVSRLWDLGNQIRRINEALADSSEMTEILLQKREVVDEPNARRMQVKAGAIDFQGVKFQYKNSGQVIRGLTFTIPPKQKVALVGPSGGGKTTLTKLLLRLYDVTTGTISVDGQDVRTVTQASLRENISYVPQEPILFHRSLAENIGYGRPKASKAEIIAAAKRAHAHEFISRLPDAYNTLVGERGIKLSGGERQRVAIARAILKNAPILILDEATSSLDSESEKYIQQALATLMRDKTVLVIAHRLSTVMQMDRIIVLENGKVTEDGSHDELLKVKEGTYQKLWEIQAGGFSDE
jgi:ATP-binding cassette subfamily B protein